MEHGLEHRPRAIEEVLPERGEGAAGARWIGLAAAFAAAALAALPVRPTGPPVAGRSEPASNFALSALPLRGDVPLVDLGSEFGPFEVSTRSSWAEYEGGAVALILHLRSLDRPGAGFSGTVHLGGALPIVSPSRTDLLLEDPRAAGAPRTPAARVSGATGYTELECRLLGGGALEGARLELERIPGSIVRRGPWEDADGASVNDAVFGHFRWSLLGPAAGALDLPRSGAGVLAFQLAEIGER